MSGLGNGEQSDGNNLQDALERTIECLREGSIIVEDYKDTSSGVLVDKIGNLFDLFKELDTLKGSFDVPIPNEVLVYVDQGKNPDLFTQSSLSEITGKHDAARGKIQTISYFKDQLASAIEAELPEEYEAYKKLKTES